MKIHLESTEELNFLFSFYHSPVLFGAKNGRNLERLKLGVANILDYFGAKRLEEIRNS